MSAAKPPEGPEVQLAAPENTPHISAQAQRSVRGAAGLLNLAAWNPAFIADVALQRPDITIRAVAERYGLSWTELMAACGIDKPRIRVKAVTSRA